MNLNINTLKLYFFHLAFTNFTDNFISKKVSLIFLIFIFGLVTKFCNYFGLVSFATGIFLLAHSTLFSFSAFLKTDARGDNIV